MSRMVHGTVRGGRIQIDDVVDLPEGCEVHLALVDAGDLMDDEERGRLEQALQVARAEIARGEGIPVEQVLDL